MKFPATNMASWLRFLLVVWLAVGSSLGFARQEASDWIAVAQLPAEGRQTLALIKQGGPFPYPRDGVVFGNFEKRLPQRFRGYYHEYTVRTPGSRNRGARRIIAGRSGEYFYTDDHYQTFLRIRE